MMMIIYKVRKRGYVGWGGVRSILLVDTFLTYDALGAIIAAIERLGRADLSRALGALEALFVKILALEHQIRLIGRDDAVAFRALFALLARETLHAERSVLFVRVDALTHQLDETQKSKKIQKNKIV